MTTSRGRFACSGGAFASCQGYWPGHHTHCIHANHVGQRSWGWRDAIVTAIAGHWLDVDYVHETASLRLWHHEALTGELAVGDPVRVHEEYHLLGGPFGWLNVIVEGGLGAVPQPAEPALWAHQMTAGVQELSTGRALPLDWVEERHRR